jgi:DNA-binding Lrp family transcriptional regulator
MMPRVAESDIALMDRWQRDFPLVKRPFARLGSEFGFDEAATLAALRQLSDAGVLSRIGAVVRPHAIGSSTLAAMRVAPDCVEEVAGIVTREPLVNHNYERAHPINLWFVIAGGDADEISATLDKIEAHSGLRVLDLPLERAYHIDLGFSLTGDASARKPPSTTAEFHPDPFDRRLLAGIADGLPLVARPFRQLADSLAVDEEDIVDRLQYLIARGVITRFGCVVRHRKLGYTANAMAVWDIPDDSVDAVAARFASNPQVTLCYRRPRRLPDWRYNLFCMVHAKTRHDAYAVIDDLNLVGETGLNEQAVLFSTRCFKQRGALFSQSRGGLH